MSRCTQNRKVSLVVSSLCRLVGGYGGFLFFQKWCGGFCEWESRSIGRIYGGIVDHNIWKLVNGDWWFYGVPNQREYMGKSCANFGCKSYFKNVTGSRQDFVGIGLEGPFGFIAFKKENRA